MTKLEAARSIAWYIWVDFRHHDKFVSDRVRQIHCHYRMRMTSGQSKGGSSLYLLVTVDVTFDNYFQGPWIPTTMFYLFSFEKLLSYHLV